MDGGRCWLVDDGIAASCSCLLGRPILLREPAGDAAAACLEKSRIDGGTYSSIAIVLFKSTLILRH